MVSKSTTLFLMGMMSRWIGTYLIKMKRKLMEAPERSVSFSADCSANDTLRAHQVLVLVVIVMRVDLQGKYNSPTTALP